MWWFYAWFWLLCFQNEINWILYKSLYVKLLREKINLYRRVKLLFAHVLAISRTGDVDKYHLIQLESINICHLFVKYVITNCLKQRGRLFLNGKHLEMLMLRVVDVLFESIIRYTLNLMRITLYFFFVKTYFGDFIKIYKEKNF